MKTKNIFFIFCCIILCSYATNSSAQAANAVVGVWKNGEGTAMVQIYEKSDKFYGKIVWLKIPNDANNKPKTDVNNPNEKLQSRPLKGLENLMGFVFKGDSVWEDGTIYDPKNGNDYSCTLTLVDNNTLEVRGFVGVSVFGRTDVWKRQVKK
jgi:uncharacterized protein (DUF2147 family)